MPVILVTMSSESYHRVLDSAARERLRALGEIKYALDPNNMSEAELQQMWRGADYALTGWGVRAPRQEWFEALPRLKAICHAAGSVRMFPRELIKRGVIVTSARAAIARTVAEFCLAGVLNALRALPAYDARLADACVSLGGCRRPKTQTLFGKTVLLIGLGHVGRWFLHLLRPFDVRVLAVDPRLDPAEARALGVEVSTLHDALAVADVVSLHAPDIPDTRGMIGAQELSLMKDGAVLVNTARGKLIDTDALTHVLANGRIRAVLDVTEPEPLPAHHPLLSMSNVLLTPHMAGPTTDELPRLGEMAVTDLERIVHGEKPIWPIGLEAYDLMSF